MKRTLSILLVLIALLSCVFTAGIAESVEAHGSGPADVSSIVSVADVPLITLNNGVQVPQLGLGTQIQALERDSSAAGRELLNNTSHDAVVAALQAGEAVKLLAGRAPALRGKVLFADLLANQFDLLDI